MLKLVVNRVRIDLRIAPVTPLLIKAGDKGAAMLHPERPDLMFVRTGSRERETVYIPGASLKGVVRSAAERILRTVGLEACDPLDHRTPCHGTASKLGDDIARDRNAAAGGPHPQAAVYKMVCHACRTFGSQALASRVSFADAYPPADERARTNATERRNGVSIDRQTGGPGSGKLFEMELVTDGAFETAIHLTNIELWQIGLVGLVLRDIEAGFVRFGSSKSRGLGHVTITPTAVLFEQTDPRRRIASPAGVAALRKDLIDAYGLRAGDEDRLDTSLEAKEAPSPVGWRWAWQVEDAAWAFLDACAGKPWMALCEGAARRSA